MTEETTPTPVTARSRLRPGAALRPGRRDAGRLIALWLTRKSAYWMAGLASILAAIRHEREVGWGFDSPAAVVALLAVLLRLVPGFVGLVLAYPLTVEYEADLAPRTGLTAPIGKWLDRRQLTRALRTLRFTHHVRQTALDRLGPTGDRLRRVETILDVVNVVFVAVGVLALALLATPA